MKVFFLNIPFHERFSRESRSPGVAPSGTLYYPIYLALAAGLVRKAGYEIDFLDAPVQLVELGIHELGGLGEGGDPLARSLVNADTKSKFGIDFSSSSASARAFSFKFFPTPSTLQPTT